VSFVQARNNGHDSNGPFRGVKRDSWEGGHRMPLVVRWPGKVAPGTRSDALLWQGDLFATLADHLDITLSSGQAPDSKSFLPVLLGSGPSSRAFVVAASSQNQLAIIGAGGWKLIDGTKGGGNDTSFDADNNPIPNALGIVGGTPKQLFNLFQDVGERNNLQAAKPAKLNELLLQLEAVRNNGH
jgi:arylsulfatase A